MTKLFRFLQTAMGMDDATWARHANPWSVYSRFTTLPLFALAVWSRVWIGGWAVVPIAGALLWIWLNPRVFPPPKRTDSWAAKGTFGERLFMTDDPDAIDNHHRRMVGLLTTANIAGAALLIWGLVALDLTLTIVGLVIAMGSKLWTVDRMVWIYEDTQRRERGSGPT